MSTLGPRATPLLLAAAAALLVGCGGGGGATDPGPATASPTSGPTASGVPAEVVAIVSQTAAGASSSTAATPLPDEAAVAEFGARLGQGRLADQVAGVVARTEVPAGQSLWAAVVSVGCDVPPGVVVTTGADGVQITPQPPTAPLRECLAPVTSVALVLVPDTP